MPTCYQITVQGHLDQRWSALLDGLSITNGLNGEAIITGPIKDQAALHGVLAKIRDIGLPLLAVQRVMPDGPDDQVTLPTTAHDL